LPALGISLSNAEVLWLNLESELAQEEKLQERMTV
jgi:hypothetical protein